MTDAAANLEREVSVLAERLRHWTRQRWAAKATPYASRSDAAFALASRFADLTSAPVPLPELDVHVIADQIAVTGHDLATADVSDDVLETALAELRRTREVLGIS